MTVIKTSSRGGHRENSGRKPKGRANRVTFACRVLPDTDTAIRERAKMSGKSQGEVLDELLREGQRVTISGKDEAVILATYENRIPPSKF